MSRRRAFTLLALLCACRDVNAKPADPARTTAAPTDPPVSSVSATAAQNAANSSVPARTDPPVSSAAASSASPAPAPSCPPGEVAIPATGPNGFVMGGAMQGDDRPHTVVLTKPFCIDATEVTVRAYKECVEAGQCGLPRQWGMWINYPTKLDHPVNKVGWRQARAYCHFRGQELPTEAQWEWAATGGDGRKWAWGDEEPTCERADFVPGDLRGPSSDDGCNGGGTSPVGAHPLGDRVYPTGRIHDLSGNVWEWTLDNYAAYPASPETDPLHLTSEGSSHVARGSGWNRSGRGIQVQYRAGAPVDYEVPSMGFRCVRAI